MSDPKTPTPPSDHWAANDPSPLAQRIRGHVSAYYDGGPPFRSPVPGEVWRAAEAKAREEVALQDDVRATTPGAYRIPSESAEL